MADQLSWKVPANLSGGPGGAGVVAGTIEIGDAHGGQPQSILVRSRSVTRKLYSFEIVKLLLCFKIINGLLFIN